ncbi:hypothetical protein GCM10023165_47630 [Variovorax defluvii]|uniref:Uncharacterized protein n=1 Tax=Variovorax defluvii TaxID=913761 RepID=A0ABP8IBF7_9BURK
MTTPRANGSSPPRSPPITPRESNNAPARRFSKLLPSSEKIDKGRPTVVVVTAGGSNHMCTELLANWKDQAHGLAWNFCAIEAGDKNDLDEQPASLADLLTENVPKGANVYIVLPDRKVSDDEVETVRQILDRLEIRLASNQPLIANEEEAWTLSPFRSDEPDLQPDSTQPATPSSCNSSRPLETDLAIALQRHAALEEEIAQYRKDAFELNQKMEAALQLLATLQGAPEPADPTPLGKRLTHAFNELQFTPHWQAAVNTAGAQALCKLIERVISEGEPTRKEVEFPLSIVLLAMREDPAILSPMLAFASKLPDHRLRSTSQAKQLYVAYMECRIRSGALDDGPLLADALTYAHCVHRYRLLAGEAAQAWESESPHFNLLQQSELLAVFDKALMHTLLNGGQQGLPLAEDVTPEVAAVAKTAWRQAMQYATEASFRDFLDTWEPWQGLVNRRQTRPEAKRASVGAN